MGLERNLTAGEIVGQVLFVARDNGLLEETGRLNIVMMGMGEPLAESGERDQGDAPAYRSGGRRPVAAPHHAIDLGHYSKIKNWANSLCGQSSPSRSTRPPRSSGLRVDADHRQVLFGGSIVACKHYPLRPWEKLTFEYALLKGVNDSDADARRVVKCAI
jgi:23S rRNA (adenine2503-C2)-methyltransferase